jgi:hypothetical protein
MYRLSLTVMVTFERKHARKGRADCNGQRQEDNLFDSHTSIVSSWLWAQ